MDRDSKIPSWDFGKLDRSTEPIIGSVVGSSGGIACQSRGLDCSVDLKLGGLGDFGSSDKWKEQSKASNMGSPSSSSKRARAPGNGSQNAACLVDGCKSDLSNCRDYHRRHKVCEAHSKTPIVMVGGQEQRFCQQCSRFHLLIEFDEVKRSCRKRLDGHNRRRRKPQPDTVNSENLFLNHKGPRFLSYPPAFPTALPEPNWNALVKNEENALYTNPPLHFIDRQQQHFSGSFSHSYKEGKRFPFLHDGDPTLNNATALETSVCQPLLNSIVSSESSNSKMFLNGISQVLDSDCALSLLSSPSQTSGINLSHMVPDRIPMAQPLVSSLQHYGSLGRYSHSHISNNVSPTGFSCSGIEDEQVGTVLVSDASDADMHCQDIFHLGGDGPSNGGSQALPFSWQQ